MTTKYPSEQWLVNTVYVDFDKWADQFMTTPHAKDESHSNSPQVRHIVLKGRRSGLTAAVNALAAITKATGEAK